MERSSAVEDAALASTAERSSAVKDAEAEKHAGQAEESAGEASAAGAEPPVEAAASAPEGLRPWRCRLPLTEEQGSRPWKCRPPPVPRAPTDAARARRSGMKPR